MSVMGRVVISVPVLSGVVAAAGYCTYRYIQSQKKNALALASRVSSYSSSESLYSAVEYLTDSEYFDALEQGLDITEDMLFERVDKLMDGDKSGIEHAYLEMEKYFEGMKACPNFLWRYAKIHHLQGMVEEYRAQKLNEKGLKYAEKAVNEDPENPEAHKWFAILTGREAEFMNDKTKQGEKAKVFFKHIQEALRLRPKDWELHHLLGVFEYKLASLNFLEKPFARLFFKGIAMCEYWAAKEHFLTAEKFNPNSSKGTKLYLAKCCIAEKNFAEAHTWLNEALNVKVKSIEDKVLHKEAKKLKNDYATKV